MDLDKRLEEMASRTLWPLSPHQQMCLGVSWSLVCLSGIFLGLRFYCKVHRHKKLWWDDWSLLFSWVLVLAMTGAMMDNVFHGFGLHAASIPVANIPFITLTGNVVATLSIVANIYSKTSFALTLIRLTEGTLKALIIFFLITIHAISSTAAILLWTTCTPLERAWKPFVPGTCQMELFKIVGIVSGAYSGAADIVLALLPWKLLMEMPMYRREKIGVAVAMSMGVFAGATAFIRCSWITLLFGPDYSYNAVSVMLWTYAEISMTIMAASIPVLRVLFTKRAKPRRQTLFPDEPSNPLPRAAQRAMSVFLPSTYTTKPAGGHAHHKGSAGLVGSAQPDPVGKQPPSCSTSSGSSGSRAASHDEGLDKNNNKISTVQVPPPGPPSRRPSASTANGSYYSGYSPATSAVAVAVGGALDDADALHSQPCEEPGGPLDIYASPNYEPPPPAVMQEPGVPFMHHGGNGSRVRFRTVDFEMQNLGNSRDDLHGVDPVCRVDRMPLDE